MRQSKTLESHKTKYPILPQIGLKIISIGNYILNLSSLTTVTVLVTISVAPTQSFYKPFLYEIHQKKHT